MALALVEPTPGDEPRADFDAFWTIWAGKKKDQKMCLLQWGYLHADDQMKAIVAAANWRPIWLRKEWEYLPDPLKWIHGERWDDELPRNVTVTAAAHAEFKPTVPGERAVMPDHVKALIAKLKGSK